MLTWGLEKARETFIHGIRRKMNNHSLGNRQMCSMTSVSWNGLITRDMAKVGVDFHLGKRKRNWITHPIANGCVVSKKGKGPKKRNMINHVITGCVPQGMTIAKQHNGWGMIGEHLFFTNLFLEDVDII